jgi:hypothetical protein
MAEVTERQDDTDEVDLIPNPSFWAKVITADGRPERLATSARMKGKSIQLEEIERSKDGDLFAVLLEIIESQGARDVDVPATLIPDLQRVGFLINTSDVGHLYGKIERIWDGALDEFVPVRFRRVDVPPLKDLVVNPTLRTSRDLEAIDDKAGREALRYLIHDGDGVVAIREPGLHVTTVFPFAPNHVRLVDRFRAGISAEELELSPEELRRFFTAGLLVCPEDQARSSRKWDEDASAGSQALAERGYFPVSSICNPYLLATMRRYYRSEIANGQMAFKDSQSERWSSYDEPLARYFHLQLTEAMSRLVGIPLKASYVYFGGYRAGAVLARHVDRKQSEVAMTLLVDFVPEPDEASPWPICLEYGEDPPQIYEGYQKLGDGLIYKGCERPHFRPPLAEGCSSSSLFLMYVREEFDGRLE